MNVRAVTQPLVGPLLLPRITPASGLAADRRETAGDAEKMAKLIPNPAIWIQQMGHRYGDLYFAAKQDWVVSEKAFNTLSAECMSCHVKNDHGFVALPNPPRRPHSPVLDAGG